MEISENSFAKLNLSLDIISKMDNGYHSMRMIMQGASLYDKVDISISDGSGITAKSNMRFLPTDSRNIAVKAANLFFNETGIPAPRVKIFLNKKIPVCAGLAGGSGNGAAVLRALNKACSAGLDEQRLCKMAEELGSDVPYCISGGTVLAEGRGEILTELNPLGNWPVVICKPKISISTPELFAKIRCEKIHHRPDTAGIISALDAGDFYGVARRMYNVFEDVLPKNASEIFKIKSLLLDNGAAGAVMSGTGSAVFGIFDDIKIAQNAHEALSQNYKECFLCETINKIC